ncbi:MAG: hypothetical protein GC151_03265 [Betaproteobacteria bacterium]|nr:hypothetical protein [Betaproteobacteria bacterium]
MQKIRTLCMAGYLISALGLGGTASAADAGGCYGAYYTNVDVLEVAPNHTVISANAFGTGYVTNDPHSPLKGAAGPCLIYNEIIDGKPNGQGRCVRTDPQGDKLLIIGKVEGFNGSGMTGTWKLVGLTGKWVGASGGGEWWDAGSGKDNKHYFLCFNGTYEMRE